MEITTIRKRVTIEPKYFTSKIHNHILTKLKEVISSECTEKYGFAVEVVDDLITVVENSGNTFLIEFQATTLKPEKDKKLTGKICMIFKDGIFIEVLERQKVLVSRQNLTDYVFDEISKTYTKGKKVLAEDSTITVKILNTKYKNNSYSCFGTIC